MWSGVVFISNFQGFGQGSDAAEGPTEQGLAPQETSTSKDFSKLQGYPRDWNLRPAGTKVLRVSEESELKILSLI